ncbi:hypothetical protein B0H17DRAFT_15719 [Mycena rosella]|uniref:Fungal STAND N-terminal Goodbye domain-containing protein n=1 Tax=Mycena rosella TaxID=1033263 RepID=A0AAD7B513_MYCRO|nr:hypothetical protein B0H17DRAFT_15719 [Mycena rosella]
MAAANDFDALWTDALNKYSEETGSDLLRSDYAQLFDDCDSVDTVVDALEEEMENFKKFRADDSKWATLRNKLKPVVRFLLLFNDAVAEAASSHTPGGRSILVAFGVLLTATQGVGDRYDALVELFEKLESFLSRLGIRLKPPSSLGPVSKTIAVKILVHLLHIFALSTKLIKKKRIMHYVQVLFGNQDMQDALARLDELTTLETQAMIAETQTTAAEILAGVKALHSSGQIDRGAINSLEIKVVKLLNLQVGRDIKTWLSAPDPSTSHNSVLKARHVGTGSWFLKSDTFANWKTTSNSVFWIYGSRRRCLLFRSPLLILLVQLARGRVSYVPRLSIGSWRHAHWPTSTVTSVIHGSRQHMASSPPWSLSLPLFPQIASPSCSASIRYIPRLERRMRQHFSTASAKC